MSKNIYVLDTNILIDDPGGALAAFSDGLIVLSIQTLEELDKLKQRHRKTGKAARRVAQEIEKLQEKGGVFIDTHVYNPSEWGLLKEVDNVILLTALRFQKENTSSTIILITNDRLLRCKARAYNLVVGERHIEQPQDILIDTRNLKKPNRKKKTYRVKKKKHGKSKRKMQKQKRRARRRLRR